MGTARPQTVRKRRPEQTDPRKKEKKKKERKKKGRTPREEKPTERRSKVPAAGRKQAGGRELTLVVVGGIAHLDLRLLRGV